MAALARTASFADLPFFAAQPGWIQTQSYVNNGQGEFDGGMHFPYNTTPRGILSGLLVNDSTYCPSIAITQEHGCLTVNAWGGGVDWPYLLQLLADPDGGAIEPCGWFGAQGAGLPGFTTTAANGDGPCALPGPANGGTTNSAAWRNYLDNTTSIYAWDAFENNSFNSPNVFAQTRFDRRRLWAVLPSEHQQGSRLRAAGEPCVQASRTARASIGASRPPGCTLIPSTCSGNPPTKLAFRNTSTGRLTSPQ